MSKRTGTKYFWHSTRNKLETFKMTSLVYADQYDAVKSIIRAFCRIIFLTLNLVPKKKTHLHWKETNEIFKRTSEIPEDSRRTWIYGIFYNFKSKFKAEWRWLKSYSFTWAVHHRTPSVLPSFHSWRLPVLLRWCSDVWWPLPPPRKSYATDVLLNHHVRVSAMKNGTTSHLLRKIFQHVNALAL